MTPDGLQQLEPHEDPYPKTSFTDKIVIYSKIVFWRRIEQLHLRYNKDLYWIMFWGPIESRSDVCINFLNCKPMYLYTRMTAILLPPIHSTQAVFCALHVKPLALHDPNTTYDQGDWGNRGDYKGDQAD